MHKFSSNVIGNTTYRYCLHRKAFDTFEAHNKCFKSAFLASFIKLIIYIAMIKLMIYKAMYIAMIDNDHCHDTSQINWRRLQR